LREKKNIAKYIILLTHLESFFHHNNSSKRNVIIELEKTFTARNPGFSTDDTITVEKARELGSGESKESSSQEQHPQQILLDSLNRI
jgi:hypothetical protein